MLSLVQTPFPPRLVRVGTSPTLPRLRPAEAYRPTRKTGRVADLEAAIAPSLCAVSWGRGSGRPRASPDAKALWSLRAEIPPSITLPAGTARCRAPSYTVNRLCASVGAGHCGRAFVANWQAQSIKRRGRWDAHRTPPLTNTTPLAFVRSRGYRTTEPEGSILATGFRLSHQARSSPQGRSTPIQSP